MIPGIPVNHARLVRQRMPVRFLVLTLLVALLWFLVMFLYVDDLIPDEPRSSTPIKRRVIHKRAPPVGQRKQAAINDNHLLVQDNGEEMLVYDHETGRRLEVERVEEEYVEIWQHGRWVRNTDLSTSFTTSPTSVMPPRGIHSEDTDHGAPKLLSPYSRLRQKPAPDEPIPKTDEKWKNGAVNQRGDADFILLDESVVNTKDARLHKLPISSTPANKPLQNQSKAIASDVLLHKKGGLETRHRAGGEGEDFHFATKEVLPTTGVSADVKLVNTKSPKPPNLIRHKETNVTNQPHRLRSTSSLVSTPIYETIALHSVSPLPTKVLSRSSDPQNYGQMHQTLVEPRQLPVPKQHYSRNSRRSGSSKRHTKHSRRHYIQVPHVNINAKAGSRVNYVNINKNGYKINKNQATSPKDSRLKWVNQSQLEQYRDNQALQDHKHSINSTKSVKGMAMTETQSLDFQKDVNDGFNRHSFNVSASNALPLIRRLPDTRPKSCLLSPPSVTSSSGRLLPLATVIICFHNEAWSTLLRTVHSVLSRSPPELLKELILVDDFSSYDYLGAQLETYISKFSQIQLVRTHKREGLIRARLLGVSYARGDVLVFLDSHCECNDQWLEPLLHAITQDRNKIVCPQIDIIHPDTFSYEGAPPNLHGGFNWHLQFVWKPLPDHQRPFRTLDSDPIRTPTMIGGLFAVNRRYFLDVGAYDPGMDIWGSENLELSFRVWMCGGSIDILPCSRVGHLFRPVIPYGFPDGAKATLHHNAMRVAEVWMDQFKKFYYASQEMPRNATVLASLPDRHQLRQNLACNNFSWYLQNIVPEMDVPPQNAQFYGQLRNKGAQMCLQSVGNNYNNTLFMSNCQQSLSNQQFAITTGGEMVHYFQCIYIRNNVPVLSPCGKVSVVWSVTKEGQVVVSDSVKADSLCLEVKGVSVVMTMCDVSKSSQLWTFTYRFDISKLLMNY